MAQPSASNSSVAAAVDIGKPKHVRPVLRRVLLGLFALAIALLAVVAVRVGPLLLAPNAYEGVPSIETRSDYRDQTLMQAAWALPNASAYRRGGTEYQANPSFCGPTSLANVMRSLGLSTDQKQVIEGTDLEPWFGILVGGLTLDELATLAGERARRKVTIVRNPSLSEFRSWMRTANQQGYRVIANFHRGPLFGRGHGHFSPVISYLEAEDLVLIGDTNEDFRPFLVSSERLWRAVNTVDEETGKKRGLIVLR